MAECKTQEFLPSFNNPKKPYSYETIMEIVNWLKKQTSIIPKVGIVCGSGISNIADVLDDKVEITYDKIPNFPTSTVKGHAGSVVIGHLAGIPVICMKGRFHFYEGYPLWKCAMPVRVIKLLGATHFICTNAAGGLRDTFKLADIMIIKDHINFPGFAGNSALQGPNDDRFGPRFPAVNEAYDKELRNQAKSIAKEIGLEEYVHEGVYACLGGPTYETIAELRMLKMLGVDTVGMSTVHEVITAVHCGMKVFAFSLVSNLAVMDYDDDRRPNHEEVIAAVKSREPMLKMLVSKMVEYIGKNQ